MMTGHFNVECDVVRECRKGYYEVDKVDVFEGSLKVHCRNQTMRMLTLNIRELVRLSSESITMFDKGSFAEQPTSSRFG